MCQSWVVKDTNGRELNSKRAKQNPWLVKLLANKERKVAAVALANKMARIGWALMMRQEDFRATSAAA
jgi:transposase